MIAAKRLLWRNRDFRRFVAGQFTTNAGGSLYTVAVLWLAFELSGSTLVTGALNAILLLPWLLQVFAGPLVDRLPLSSVLVGSQVVQGLVVLVLPLAAATGNLHVGVLFAVAPVLMLATLVMAPMETALLPRIVDDGHLSEANSALATVTLGLDMVFDAVGGGGLIAVFGATTLFVIDSLTFAVAALLFAGIALGTPGTPERTEESDDTDASVESVLRSYVSDLRAGVDVLRGTLFVELLLTTAVANFATGVALAILPAFGAGIGGPAIYGLLLGALGIGRLVGSVVGPYIAGIPYGKVLLLHGLGAGCWVAAVLLPSPTLTVVLFGLAWVPAGASGVLMATLNQRLFPADLLGRVAATKGTASGATLPLGSLVGGIVAETLGTTTMALAASGFGFTAVYILLRPRLRRLPAVGAVTPADFDLQTEPDLSAT
ncbi:macrolide-efflux protein / Permease [Halovivax asiaticus JCM 14624]|uniref:Macrolide-efflux protein / Permease n=1 Tax=Halovivax asiaticus JCM 14624 TaxID=1227490 RepID=M0BEH0_9EURY|nr:MFS transporter [Halovivax asiaticus]ELZ09240.1 macrolide-efflux protein / Permease [Halovivax asiaticus JCM 14624]